MRKITAFIPSAILIVVVLHQIYLTRSHQLSPWKGGGFGMFSSTDSAAARYLRVFLSAQDRSEELQIPNSIAESAAKASLLPDDSLLQNLAEKIVSREERYARPVDRVRIEVWRTRFDAVTLEPRNEKLRDYVFQVVKPGR